MVELWIANALFDRMAVLNLLDSIIKHIKFMLNHMRQERERYITYQIINIQFLTDTHYGNKAITLPFEIITNQSNSFHPSNAPQISAKVQFCNEAHKDMHRVSIKPAFPLSVSSLLVFSIQFPLHFVRLAGHMYWE